ncbi:MAG: phosphoribosylformylglycinamidine synthase II, partial [Alphaproteobacteria bacterium HGW-Alphaproteobacteria-2]
SPNHCARNWVFEQYDHMVLADTLRRPGQGAGVVRVHGTKKALAFTADVTPRYCAADPREGGRQAVAEAFRNLCAVGARPLAATDCLNFGNPEKPGIMGQFVGCIEGLAEACRALDMPIVSGNVSLYNETDGRAILPTPTIGAVGLLESLDEMISGPAQPGDVAVLLGETRGHLGQSALLWEMRGRAEGPPPPVDLVAERLAGDFLRAHHGLIRAATDLSDGGLALAAFEMAASAGCGAQIDGEGTGWFFGEDQGRYLLAVAPQNLAALTEAARAAGVPATEAGGFGGTDFALGAERAPMADLAALWSGAFAAALG